MPTYSYIGKGSIYVGTAGSLIPVGNVSALSLAIEQEKKEMVDYENAGGGVVESVSRITRVGFNMTALNISPENLALALRGAQTTRVQATITDEPHNDVICGSLIPLARIPDASALMTVKKAAATLVENTDYTRTRAGIIPLDSATVSDGDDLTISYTAVADNLLEALVNAGLEYRLFFEGLNEAKSGKPFLVDLFKVKFTPTSGLDLIGDEFGELALEGDVIKDDTKSGAGISQYFNAKIAQV